MEKIVETKTCKHCSISFDITDKDMEFYEKVSPIFGGKKYLIPSPTLCPDCRQQRRLSFRNERKLYKRKCDFSGKEIVSVYSPDKQYKVYEQEKWWGDGWDAMDYGGGFDFCISFFTQLDRLQRNVPKIAIMNDDGMGSSENSAYCQDFAFGKNCYIVSASWYIEDCTYGECICESKDIIDSIMIFNSHDIYEGIDCKNVFNCTYVQNCNDSNNCHFSYGLSGCDNCFGCSELKNKSYYVLNISYSKEEYEIKKEYYLHNKERLFKEVQKLFLSTPRKNLIINNSENSLGDNIINSKNIFKGFEIIDSKDLRYCTRVNTNSNDCMDVHQSGTVNLVYEGLTPDKTFKGAFLTYCWEGCKDIYYSDTCINCSDCFGCIGLRNKSYCILNKQYTKEEYETLVPKIIEHMMTTGEWGEFFPSSMSPFGYNETVAMEYYPITPPYQGGEQEGMFQFSLSSVIARKDDEAISEDHHVADTPRDDHTGPLFNWSTYESPTPKVDKIIPANKLPTNIEDIPDDILNWAIECEVTKKPFRIIQQELEFYRKHKLPIPRRHPDQRHLDRMALRNPRKLYERLCDCETCEEHAQQSGSFKKEDFQYTDPESSSGGQRRRIQTTYAPERPEIVYCETCYNKEVY